VLDEEKGLQALARVASDNGFMETGEIDLMKRINTNVPVSTIYLCSFKFWHHAYFCATLRFIPNREGQDLQASYSLLHDDGSPATPSRQKKRIPHTELHFQRSKFTHKQAKTRPQARNFTNSN
jgi:hypothetical protein